MPEFSSARERRLWLMALGVLAAIYASAWLGGALADMLSSRGLLGVAFAAGFGAVLIAIVGSSLARIPRRAETLAIVGVVAAYAMVLVRLGTPAPARSHIFEFGMLSVLLYHALSERRMNGARAPQPAVTAVIATALLGWIDEGIQALVPGRVYDLRDVGVNALAGLGAVAAGALVSWARRRDFFRR